MNIEDDKEEEKKLISQMDNLEIDVLWKDHPITQLCKRLHEKIQSYEINELKEYLKSKKNKKNIEKLHEQYYELIDDIPNESILKQEIDGLLWYLDIPPNRFLIDPITHELRE